jgi:hypothetical protein
MSDTIYRGQYRNSFGGADITAVFGNSILGSLQAISYAVTREKGPIYTMGSSNPRSWARNKRAISGTLIFIMFDKSSLLYHMRAQETASQFYAKRLDKRLDDSLFSDSDAFGTVGNVVSVDNAIPNFNEGPSGLTKLDKAWYADQIPPFDVNISAANEFGAVSKKTFIGVELMNEGGGVSIDDLVIEEQFTYVCRDLTPWVLVQSGQVAKANYQ